MNYVVLLTAGAPVDSNWAVEGDITIVNSWDVNATITGVTATENRSTSDLAALLGRVLIAAIFIMSGWNKVIGFAGTAGYIASKGLPVPQVLAAATIALEVIGGLLLIIGWKARWVALAFAAFTLVASFVFHNYWTLAPAQQMAQQLFFMKNMSIVGGMLMVVAFGPGAWSVDRR